MSGRKDFGHCTSFHQGVAQLDMASQAADSLDLDAAIAVARLRIWSDKSISSKRNISCMVYPTPKFLALLQLCDPTEAANAKILELQSQVGGLSGEDHRPQPTGTISLHACIQYAHNMHFDDCTYMCMTCCAPHNAKIVQKYDYIN
jgi:hypothetical protein